MEPLDYCRNLVAPPGSDLYYALRFTPSRARAGLLAVHAFAREVTAIPHNVSDTGVAAVKLNWWREEFDRTLRNEGRHPVSQALGPVIAARGMTADGFRELLEGAAMDLEYGAYPGFRELSVYLHRTAGALESLSVSLCGPVNADTTRFAHDLGMGLGLFDRLRTLRRDVDAGRCYIPEDELRDAGVDRSTLAGHATPPAVRDLLTTQAARVDDFLVQADRRLSGGDRRAQHFGLIRLALARTLLREMADDGYPLLERGFELTPVRKLWIAWRTARRNRRDK